VTLGLIWAQSTAGVIGRDGALPWRLPEDLAHFREVTDGHPVIMGRATWVSLPERFRPLPGRANVVLSGDPAFVAAGARVAPTLEAALVIARGEDAGAEAAAADDEEASPPRSAPTDVWVIGGAAVYAAALPLADVLEVTEVDLDVPGDAFAPAVDPGEWRTVTGPWRTSGTGLRYRFVRRSRRRRGAAAPVTAAPGR
jgi:dihydrofolate reductase